jgi:hypothetical protein
MHWNCDIPLFFLLLQKKYFIMDLKEIMSVSGYSGLFKFVSQGRSGLIVESLVDKKRTNIPPTAKVSNISDIAVFTDSDDVPLRELLQTIKEKSGGGPSIDPKSAKEEEVRQYFTEILPSYDKNRVYFSDIKKIISWYNLLQQNGILNFEAAEEKPDEAAEKSPAAEAEAKKLPVKPVAAKPVAKPAQHVSSKAAGSAGKINAPRKAQ